MEYLKTDEHLGHIPIMMVTSLDADKHRKRAFDLGAAEYLIKPCGSRDLERLLDSLKVQMP